MKLPNAEQAIVERKKITDYLLNPTHPDNGGKAAFFVGLGYNETDWTLLADALRRLAATANVAARTETTHGIKYVLDGGLETPSGATYIVRTVWIVDHGLDMPRLVTAYPHGE